MSDLNIAVSLQLSKGGVSIPRQLSASFNISALVYAARTMTAPFGSDGTLDMGDVSPFGFLLLNNLEARVLVAQLAAPTVTPQGTTGAATWSYKIVPLQTDGSYAQASSAGTTATGNATLTGGNYNAITWTADANASGGYDIYRTAHGSSPSTNGLIGHVASGTTTFNDTGLAGDSATAPATAIDNMIKFGDDGSSYPVVVYGREPGLFRVNPASGTILARGNTRACLFEYILLSK